MVHSCPKKVAGFFAESIQVTKIVDRFLLHHVALLQGVGGTVQFPKNFLHQAVEMIRERGGLYVADEVRTLIIVLL